MTMLGNVPLNSSRMTCRASSASPAPEIGLKITCISGIDSETAIDAAVASAACDSTVWAIFGDKYSSPPSRKGSMVSSSSATGLVCGVAGDVGKSTLSAALSVSNGVISVCSSATYPKSRLFAAFSSSLSLSLRYRLLLLSFHVTVWLLRPPTRWEGGDAKLEYELGERELGDTRPRFRMAWESSITIIGLLAASSQRSCCTDALNKITAADGSWEWAKM
mmetsp:Transcript_8061/g.14319  ORF Transcript_8061/g.14319 Transcript_8061/m.14319 type:complete len:220 (+) Transcript_8061:1936-2595(+)